MSLDLLPDALTEALASVVAEQRREWRLEHDTAMAEVRALLADARRENSELRSELKEQGQAILARVEQDVAALMLTIKSGDPGPPGPPGENGRDGRDADPDELNALREEIRGLGEWKALAEQTLGEVPLLAERIAAPMSEPIAGPEGPPGVGIRTIERDGDNLIVTLDDDRALDLGELPRGEKGDVGPIGESVRGEKGDPGDPGVGISVIEREGNRLLFVLDDERRFDAGDLPRGEKGEIGAAGRDGIGVKDFFVDREGILIVTCDDGSARRVGMVVGRDGKDGTSGNIDRAEIRAMVEEVASDSLAVPEHLLGLVERAGDMVSQAFALPADAPPPAPAITLNVSGPPQQRDVRKIITTSRDAVTGALTAEVVEHV